jgi:hypothetical protein
MQAVLYPVTRWLPRAILWITAPLSDAPTPPDPSDLPAGIALEDLAEAGNASSDRARAAVPAAGLLGTIAGIFHGTLQHRTLLVVVAAATILSALFSESARVDQGPGATIDDSALKTAAYGLRRKEAWSRVATYLAVALAAGLVYLAATS